MRTVFMGTPEFAVPCLEMLTKIHGVELCGVFTQPDRPKGRGKKNAGSPVKAKALELNIDVFQPISGRDDSFVETLSAIKPDLIVVVAYGIILPLEVLLLPRYGCINVHASLLPQYRGAAPIQQCIIDRCQVTGVTTMLMDEGLDTGDIIIQKNLTVSPEETSATLHDKLSVLGAATLEETVNKIQSGTATYTPQNNQQATYTSRLKKESGRINWHKTAEEIEALIRGLQPWPTAFTELYGKMMKIWSGKALDQSHNSIPGVILDVTPHYFAVSTAEGILLVQEIQMEGKKRMSVNDYLKGNLIAVGSKLGV